MAFPRRGNEMQLSNGAIRCCGKFTNCVFLAFGWTRGLALGPAWEPVGAAPGTVLSSHGLGQARTFVHPEGAFPCRRQRTPGPAVTVRPPGRLVLKPPPPRNAFSVFTGFIKPLLWGASLSLDSNSFSVGLTLPFPWSFLGEFSAAFSSQLQLLFRIWISCPAVSVRSERPSSSRGCAPSRPTGSSLSGGRFRLFSSVEFSQRLGFIALLGPDTL